MWYAMIQRLSGSADQWKGGERACAEGREPLPEELHRIKAGLKEEAPGPLPEDLPEEEPGEEEPPLEEPESEVPPQRQSPTQAIAKDKTADDDDEPACWYYAGGPCTSNPESEVPPQRQSPTQ